MAPSSDHTHDQATATRRSALTRRARTSHSPHPPMTRRARTSTSSTSRRLLGLLAALAPVAASRAGDAWLAARRARVAERAGRWAAVLANYSAVQRAERARGADAKYIVAFAGHYGLGNRIATVTSALALAVASRRALIVLWPRGRMHGRPDYDPAGVVDLFAPTLVDWSTPPDAQQAVRRCAEDVAKRPRSKGTKRWAIGDPHDAKTAEALRAFDFSADDWRPGDRVLCAFGYYYWGWALTCNDVLGGADVLADYGALQSLLLTPTAAVADRVGRILGRSRCDVGVHLRKADGAKGGPSTHWVAKLRAVLVPGATAFVAADPQSTLTKKLILASFPAVRFLARDADAEATRSTVDGVLDALADNYVLSACRAIIPREIGASTFHDAAVARAAFGFAWPRNETLAYHAQPPRDPIFGPAHCDELSRRR